MLLPPFTPSAATVNIPVGASSGNVLVTRAVGPCQIRVMNAGTAPTWIAFGNSSIAATLAGSMPVAAGGTEVLTVPQPFGDSIYAAAIASGSNGNIYFTPGSGI